MKRIMSFTSLIVSLTMSISLKIQIKLHIHPTWLTETKGESTFLGLLLDGFPIYGPEDESGNTLTTTDLDEYHGHTHATDEYPDEIYHYHCTDDAPWINGGEYYGTPGTVTQ